MDQLSLILTNKNYKEKFVNYIFYEWSDSET